MTLSTSTVLGNYTHSEPKFIGASPERKDYPISTENCDIKVTSQHAQPGTKITIGEPVQYTKSGVYISKITQPDFSIEFKTKTEQAARDFKIGDRVKVIGSTHTQQSLRDRGLEKCHNEFGIVKNIENEHVQSVEGLCPKIRQGAPILSQNFNKKSDANYIGLGGVNVLWGRF